VPRSYSLRNRSLENADDAGDDADDDEEDDDEDDEKEGVPKRLPRKKYTPEYIRLQNNATENYGEQVLYDLETSLTDKGKRLWK